MKIHCLLLAAVLLARIAGGAEPPAQKLLPKDTAMVVSIPDAGKALGVLTNSSLGRLWRDAAVRAFKDKFTARLQSAAVAPLERQLGVHFAEYQGLAQGQLTFAIVPVDHPAKGGDHYAAIFLLDAGDHAAQLSTNLAALKKSWLDAGKTLKTVKIRDAEFATVVLTTDDISLEKLLPVLTDTNSDDNLLPKPDPEKMELVIGQSGSLLLVSKSTEVIEKILAREAGGLVPGLDEQPVFQRDFAARLQGAPVFAWVNAGNLLSEWLKPGSKGGDQTPAASPLADDGALAALGLNGLTSASIAYRETPEGLCAQIFVGAPEPSRRGLLRALGTEAKDSGPPAFVPGDVVKFSRVRLDLPRSWKLIESTLGQLNPTLSQVLNYALDVAGKAQDEKYDLRTELLGSMGDDIISYQRNPINNTIGDLREAPEILLIGSPSPLKLAAALKVATGLFVPAGNIKDREFLGRKIYSATLPMSLQGGSRAYHFAASGGYVAVTSDVDMLEEFLRSNDSSKPGLSQTPGLGDAAQKAGGGMNAGIFAYSNDKADARALLETLHSETISGPDLLGLLGLEMRLNKISTVEEANQFKTWCDFSLLPAADALTKYFSYSVWVGGFTDEGFMLNCFTPTPPSQN